MEVYVYQAALYCEECAHGLIEDMRDKSPADMADDSDVFPQGPYMDGGGEADSPQHCDNCGVFLENDLTTDGYHYLLEMLAEGVRSGRGNREVLAEWASFYAVDVAELLEWSMNPAPKEV